MAKQLNPRADPYEPKHRQLPPPPALVSPVITYMHPTYYFGPRRYFFYRSEKRVVQRGSPAILAEESVKKVVVPVPPRLRANTFQRKFRLQWRPKTSFSAAACRGADVGCGGGGGGAKTSVMIRNIPNQYRRKMLIEFLDKLSDQNHLEYDFLYLPMDFVRGNNLGYAFVNFTTAKAATKIREVLKGYEWGFIETEDGSSVLSKKICEVKYARLQGKEALIRNFKESMFCCSNKEWLPLTFTPPRNGSGVTKQITIGKCRALISS